MSFQLYEKRRDQSHWLTAKVIWPPNKTLANAGCSASYPVECGDGRRGQSAWVLVQETIWGWSKQMDDGVGLVAQN